MIVLDTDHLSELQREGSAPGRRLLARLGGEADSVIATTIITFEEQLRGRLASLHAKKTIHEEVPAYERLGALFIFHQKWLMLPFDQDAARRFESSRRQGIRVGTMDLKIASIALSRGAILLSRNRRDFGRVPGLHVENWLDD